MARKKKGSLDPGAKGPGPRRLFLSFFKGTGVLIRVTAAPRGSGRRKVKVSGAVARSVRPKLVSFFESLPLEDASIRFALDEECGWRIEHTEGITPGIEQRIRNFLVNEA